MLTRVDETELLLPLHGGATETPPFGTFLARLRQRLRCTTVAMETGGAMPELHFAGVDPESGPRLRAELPATGSPRLAALRPGRVYAAEELFDATSEPAVRARIARRSQPAAARLLRVAPVEGPDAWLIAIRDAGDFAAADGALVAGLAPHLAIALGMRARLIERERSLAAADMALDRAGVAWLAFDAQARLLAYSHGAAAAARVAGGREPLLAAACGEYAAGSRTPRLIRLAADSALELVALPGGDTAALLALVRRPSGRSDPALLMQAHGLSASEARLAGAIAQGASLAEAGAACGLTIETARNYSKRIFAKTGTRGQADLVRRVLTGPATLGRVILDTSAASD